MPNNIVLESKSRDSCADVVIGFTHPFILEDSENLILVRSQTPLLLLFKEIEVRV